MNRGTMGVNSLPKTCTWQRRDWDSNLGPSAPESSTLTTRLLDSNAFERNIHLVPKKRPPFHFLNNSSKLTDFNDFWYVKSRENLTRISYTPVQPFMNFGTFYLWGRKNAYGWISTKNIDHKPWRINWTHNGYCATAVHCSACRHYARSRPSN